MKVKGDDHHREAVPSDRRRRSRRDQIQVNLTRFWREKGGVKCVLVARRMLLVMGLTEMRSTIEYYVLRYTADFWCSVFW